MDNFSSHKVAGIKEAIEAVEQDLFTYRPILLISPQLKTALRLNSFCVLEEHEPIWN